MSTTEDGIFSRLSRHKVNEGDVIKNTRAEYGTIIRKDGALYIKWENDSTYPVTESADVYIVTQRAAIAKKLSGKKADMPFDLRDQFAGQALQTFRGLDTATEGVVAAAAEWAYRVADAMMEARKR